MLQDLDALSPDALMLRWHALAPARQGFRCEMDEYGELLVRPRLTEWQRDAAIRLGTQLHETLGGHVLDSTPVATRLGIRLLDVCWTPSTVKPLSAPAVCVQIATAFDTPRRLRRMTEAYLAAGALEVVTVSDGGGIRFATDAGEKSSSSLGVELTLPPGA